MAATNASGTTTVRYGGMRAHVLALEVVLADGRVIRTGSRAGKTSAGYDLTQLFVGSEGTLGVITELTVRLHGMPEHVVAARARFADLDAACAAAAALAGSGLSLTRAELRRRRDDPRGQRVQGHCVPGGAEPLPRARRDARRASEGDLEAARELADGCTARSSGRSSARRSGARSSGRRATTSLFALQHALARAGAQVAPTSACRCPSFPARFAHARADADERGLPASIVAHAGDGNYHVLFMLDPDDPAQRRGGRGAQRRHRRLGARPRRHLHAASTASAWASSSTSSRSMAT